MTKSTKDNRPQPFAIIILDGWGYSNETSDSNAVALANTPYLDSLKEKYPNTLLKCSGLAVGLPEGQMGNSEVGHLNIGAGRIVYQDLTRISKSIANGSFFANDALLGAMRMAKSRNSSLHLMGLVSDGGVHSSDDHYFALIKMARREGVENLYFHAFLDGRDVAPRSALEYVGTLEDHLRMNGYSPIATISGRYYAMDRDNRWDRVKRAYDAIVHREGLTAKTAEQAITASYQRDEADEFVQPTVIANTAPVMGSEDAVIFYNFRADRTRELSRALLLPEFSVFDRGDDPPLPYFVTMTEYEKDFTSPIAFPQEDIVDTFADVLSANGLKQLHIAETEKYAHVTFFFNGGVEEPKVGEERILIPSPKVPTYDLKPEMSAYEVAERTVEEIDAGNFDVIIMNFANCDMVGHTGIMSAAVAAVEAVDRSVSQVVEAVKNHSGECFILADHGNAEEMVEPGTTNPHTAHTSNMVPFIYVTESAVALHTGGALCDVIPTALEILKIAKPSVMTGESLIVH